MSTPRLLGFESVDPSPNYSHRSPALTETNPTRPRRPRRRVRSCLRPTLRLRLCRLRLCLRCLRPLPRPYIPYTGSLVLHRPCHSWIPGPGRKAEGLTEGPPRSAVVIFCPREPSTAAHNCAPRTRSRSRPKRPTYTTINGKLMGKSKLVPHIPPPFVAAHPRTHYKFYTRRSYEQHRNTEASTDRPQNQMS